MKYNDVLFKERKRADRAQGGVAHLLQEGMFYRAYEWSAWLCFRYIKAVQSDPSACAER